MQLDSPARARFKALIERPVVPLDEAALAIAAEEYPALDAADYLARLDDLGALVRRRSSESQRTAGRLRALSDVLFGQLGFRGNEEAYYDPRNSFLNEVLERRLGIPISLSVLLMEVGRRVGIPLHGVGLPRHFMVKLQVEAGPEVFIDAFNGGALLSREECAFRSRGGPAAGAFDPHWFQAVTPRQLLFRMLQNLKQIYMKQGDDVRTYWVVDRLLLLAPDELEELRDRGILSARLGLRPAAARDLGTYLERVPGAPDASEIREVLATLRAAPNLLN
ncbi:MAG TPA: transglutaminase-like domain-containing protein [Anaeromyxobacter sp.]|nr:transglutaminase-like domain-containing protein [Anaeromyxobacter sp.]